MASEPVISDRDFTIATIAAPAALKSEESGAEDDIDGEATEGEDGEATEGEDEEGGEE